MYILAYAKRHNGFIISNDHFRDHIEKLVDGHSRNGMISWLRDNRCGYTFRGNEFIINPMSSLSRLLEQEQDMSGSYYVLYALLQLTNRPPHIYSHVLTLHLTPILL